MDNKKDRKFYWEVKDFMFNQTAPNSKKAAPDMKDTVKSILEQNQAFKQKINGANNTTIQSIGQAISLFESKQKSYSSKAEHAKNVDTNPFRQLNEAQTTWAAIKNLFSSGTQQLVGGTKENEEEENMEATRRFVGAPEPPVREGDTSRNPTASIEAAEKFKNDNALMFGRIPQGNQSKPTEAEETLPGKDLTFQTPEQIEDMNNPEKGGQSGAFGAGQQAPQEPSEPSQTGTAEEREAYQKARQASYEKRNLRRRQEAEQNLAKAEEIMKTATGRNRIALAGNITRLRQEMEGSRDFSAEQIAGMSARDTERRFRTPEQQAAKEAESKARLDDMIRLGNEARQNQTGTKTQPTQTAQPTQPTQTAQPTQPTQQTQQTKPAQPLPKPVTSGGPRGTAMDVGNDASAMAGARDRMAQGMFGSNARSVMPQQSFTLNAPSTTTQVNSIAGRMMGVSPTQKIGSPNIGQMTAQAMLSGNGNVLGNAPFGNVNLQSSQQNQTTQANNILKFLQGK